MSFFKTYSKQLLALVIIACGIFLCLEILRDIQREGDLGGYIEAGKLAWQGDYIYSAHRNTWPPFMSIASIPLHWLNQVSFVGLRLVWLLSMLATYWLIFKWTISFFTSKELVFKLSSKNKNEISLTNPLFLLPFLLTLRIFIEEISNLQVNVSILAICILSLILTLKQKHFWAGILLALVISTKVYPIILIPFLLFKREFRTTLWTIIGLGLTHTIVLFYFGDGSTALYTQWYTKQVVDGLQCIHYTQSLWSLFCGLFSETSRFDGWYFNIASLTVSQTKILTLSVIGSIGLWVSYMFYTSRKQEHALAIQWLIVLSFIPVFSPLAWKCYFVFIAPIVILLYHKLKNTSYKWLLYVSLFIITFTSEIFLGNTLSDVTESMGFITLSSLFLSLLATHKLTNTP